MPPSTPARTSPSAEPPPDNPIAAALAARDTPADEFLGAVLDHVPDGGVAPYLRIAADLPFTADPRAVAAEVGSGHRISAPDTVPYALWCAARHLDDLTEALWATARSGGDVDTTCAIVGGVVAARTGVERVPADWLASCEPLPDDT